MYGMQTKLESKSILIRLVAMIIFYQKMNMSLTGCVTTEFNKPRKTLV